jgi:hypothetical protein
MRADYEHHYQCETDHMPFYRCAALRAAAPLNVAVPRGLHATLIGYTPVFRDRHIRPQREVVPPQPIGRDRREGEAVSVDEGRLPASGTEHIVLGLARENEGAAARILRDFDAEADKIHNEVIRNLSGPAGRLSAIGATESARASSGMFEHLSERARNVIDWALRAGPRAWP